MARTSKPQYRFGIGEWYGRPFVNLTPQERRHFAEIQQIAWWYQGLQNSPEFIGDKWLGHDNTSSDEGSDPGR